MRTLENIQNALRGFDALGLIKIGAPDDEYNFEAEMIFHRGNSPADCLAVFTEMFDEKISQRIDFDAMAAAIEKHIQD